jgi:N-acetyl-D-muramate 6-phosphate phosphatase
MIKAVLFDLDGTLADTAPDLGRAINRMRSARGLPELPLSATRPVTSHGASGLLHVGFGIGPEHADYRAMRQEFLALYEQDICRETRLFPGNPELLASIEERGLRWGIVTNKAERLARLLLAKLGLAAHAACIVGGDSTPHIKPHPASLLHAAEVLNLAPKECMYLGDDLRDIQAARAAGMHPIAVDWGYHHPEHGGAGTWQADTVIARPHELTALL